MRYLHQDMRITYTPREKGLKILTTFYKLREQGFKCSQILDLLKISKPYLFALTRWVRENPEMYKKLLSEGGEINHV